jgi:putative Ig domain-containing protein
MQRLTMGHPALLAAVLLTVSCGSDHPTDVSQDPIAVSTTTLPPAVQRTSYTAMVQASGGVPPYAWSVQSGALPAGIALDGATGTLSGTATESGDFPVTIRVTDAASGTADVDLTIHVESGPAPLAITPPGPLVATIGTTASAQFSATGGTPPYRWTASGVDVGLENSLPNGITLEEDGRLTGVPGYPAGTYHFQIDVFDAAHTEAHLLADLVVQAPSGLRVTDPLPPEGVIGQPYSFQFHAAGGAPPYAWTIWLGGNPPDGLVLSGDGTLSGTPTHLNETISVLVTDAVGATAFAVVPLEIVAAPLEVPEFTFPDAVVGQHYDFSLVGGGPPSNWTVSAGALPPGLAILPLLHCCSEVDGVPTEIGVFSFQLTLTLGSESASRDFTLTVRPTPMTVVTTSLPDGEASTPYQVFLVADGGTAPYTWSLDAGTLPAGVTLSAAGELSGTPGAAGTFDFTVLATDSSPAGFQQSATSALSWTIDP